MVSFALLIISLYGLSLYASFHNKVYQPFDNEASQKLKGVSCLLIICYHLNFHVATPLVSFASNWGAPVVSLFLFISGYGLMASYLKKGPTYLNGFLNKRLWKIIKPLLLVTLVYQLAIYLDQGIFNTELLFDLINKGITPLPFSWFAYSIIIFYIFFFFAFRLNNSSLGSKILLMIIFSIIYMIILFRSEYERAWWVSSLAFPSGLIYRFREKEIIAVTHKTLYHFILAPLACIFIYSLVQTKIELLFPIVYFIIPALIVNLLSFLNWKNDKIFTYLGKISYEVYLLHGFWIYLLRGKHIFIASDYLYILTIFSFTFISAVFLHRLLNPPSNKL
ncbi:acyltransferase family protein [Sphingobacterium siyangense]|uniref:acyltransferase family protein n=1 Tax=Sphingobacterium siyangense TaxID=459529 RepID=UPI0030165782